MPHGFVDIQNNGWMGTSFTEPGLTAEKLKEITRELIARGTIAFCPTVVTSSIESYKDNFAVIAKGMSDPEIGGHILGIHLEGPFISPLPGAIGAHPKNYVLKPDIKTFDKFQGWASGNIKLLTVAPEMPGCEELIQHAVSQGVVVSIGHHMAADDIMERAVMAGVKLCTHLGNGIPNQIHRHNNPLWWQLACDNVSALFITDGHHLPADLIKVALRAKTVNRFIVISDASELAGMPPGRYTILDGLPVSVNETGRIYSEKTQMLAGSHSTLLECMNYLASLNLLTEKQLWQVGFENPLRVLGRNPEDIVRLAGPDVFFENGKFVIKKASGGKAAKKIS